MTNSAHRPDAFSTWRFLFPGGRYFLFWAGTLAIYTIIVLWVDDHYFPKKQFMEMDAVTTTSVVMGTLLVFRTNSAYDRWWEARKLWGMLVNETRNLVIKTREYVRTTDEEKQAFGKLLAGFSISLRDHLRFQAIGTSVREHVPLKLARQIYSQLRTWQRQEQLSELDLLQMDAHARALMDVCGGCERIAKSPIAGSYKALLRAGLAGYFLGLPWLLVDTFEWYTLIIVLISCFFVIGLELLAEEVEQPFGTQPNDLPIDAICKTIGESIKQELEPPSGTADSLELTSG